MQNYLISSETVKISDSNIVHRPPELFDLQNLRQVS